MKKILFLLISLSSVFTMQAQVDGYFFSQFTAPYTDLPATKTVLMTAWTSPFNNIQMPEGIDMQFFGMPISSSMFLFSNRGYLIYDPLYAGGEFIVSGMGADMAGIASSNGAEISYVIEGTYPSRILKMEYKNAGFYTESPHQSTVNFQIWLYQADNSIEMRYGTSSIETSSAVPEEIGIFHDEVFSVTNSIEVFGDPTNATVDNGNLVDGQHINSVPPANTVYRFVPSATGVATTPAIEKYVAVSYDDSYKMITVSVNGDLKADFCQIYSSYGQVVYSKKLNGNSFNVQTDFFAPGLYIIKTSTNKGLSIKKIMVR